MEKSTDIVEMGVSGVQYLIERAYREGSEMQFVRELYKNAIEAGATKIEFGPEWQGVERHDVYRLMVADNGKGMNADQIEAFLNTFGGGGKPIGDAHENYGIGAKTSTLPWNHKGAVILSWTKNNPEGVMLWLCKDPLTGEYGSKKFETIEGEFEIVVPPFNDKKFGIDWSLIKPEWIKSSGTVVVCLGNTGKEDTFMQKAAGDDYALKGISSYLNKRIWEIPKNVQVSVQELRSRNKEKLPKSLFVASKSNQFTGEEYDLRWNKRKVKGAKYHLLFRKNEKGGMKATGTVVLQDHTQIEWYLWEGERPDIHAVAHEKGYIAALYQNELYDVKTHHSSFRSFRISASKVRENLTIIAKPPILKDYVGVYPDTARNTLKIMGTKKAGEPLPWGEWGEEFAANLPAEIVEALKSAISASSGTLEDTKWRQKLAERFSKRWNQRINRIAEDGQALIHPNQTLNLFQASEEPEEEGPRSIRGLQVHKPRDKDLNAGLTTPGKDPSKETDTPRGIPDYRWVKEDDVEPGVAAAWQKPSITEPNGVVLLNRDFEMFEEVVKYWQQQYPDHLSEKIEITVQEIYGQAMVARIAHSESLTRNKNWGRQAVEQKLRSPESLTMAVLGLVTEDYVIANKLGALLSKRQSN